QLAVANLCQQRYKRLYAAAVRFYAAAFAADPKLADDLNQQSRYQAACAAAQAAAGKGEDAAALTDPERARLRQQALDWLRADLAAWTKHAQDQPPAHAEVGRILQRWQQDSDLAGLRVPEALANLTQAERDAWRGFWVEVEKLLQQVREAK